LGIITNGSSLVQKNKIDALNISNLFDIIIYADSIGNNSEFWKPSPVPFSIALKFFHIDPIDAIYIGDDPAVDFQGARLSGIKTIRINSTEKRSPIVQDADYVIHGLNEVLPILEVIENERKDITE
jgi:FMN phosphatase YigB (HAD superfamily)